MDQNEIVPNRSALEFASTPRRGEYDAVVIGSGPNGLAAAIELAKAGRSVLVMEAKATIGGGTRTEELTLPGYLHDVCSAVHPMAVASPFFRALDLEQWGLKWCYPPASLAQPFEDGTAAVAYRSLDETVKHLGEDGPRYQKLFEPLVKNADAILAETLGPIRMPRHPIVMTRFGLRAVYSATTLANRWFRGKKAKGLFAGMAAHSVLPLEKPLTSAVGLMLGLTAHAVGWPVAKGGSREITNAMAKSLLSFGGEMVVNSPVAHLSDVPKAKAVLFDVTPRQIVEIARQDLPEKYVRKLKKYRYGPGVFKVDWALDGPIPWKAEECLLASTVHVGGTLEEVADAERAAWENRIAERPFLLIAQQSLFDETRAPGRQACGVGLLPCSQRVHGGYDRPHRTSGRTLRAGLSRPHPRQESHDPHGLPRLQRQLRRWGHHRRRDGSPPTVHKAGFVLEPLRHAEREAFHLFLLHTARRRRPRHVRLPRGKGGAAESSARLRLKPKPTTCCRNRTDDKSSAWGKKAISRI